MNAASVPMMPPVLAAVAILAPGTWRRPASPRSWVASSTTWASPVAPQGMASGHEAPRGVDRDPAPADRRVAGHRGRPGVARLEETQRLEGVELLGAGGIVELDDVHVLGSYPGGVPRRAGRLGQALVVVEVAVARAHRARDDPGSARCRLAGEEDGSGAVSERRAHEAGQGPGDGRRGKHLACGDLRLELGVRVQGPVVPGLHGGGGELFGGGVPLFHLDDRPCGVEAHEHGPRRVLELLVHLDPVGERHPVLDPGDGLGPVAGPHLLGADRQHQASVGPGSQGGQVESRGPAGTGVVDVDDPGVAQSGTREERLTADATLVEEPAGRGVAEDDQVDSGGVHAGVGNGLAHDLVRHVLEGPVPPVHRGDGHAGDVCEALHECPSIVVDSVVPRSGGGTGEGLHEAVDLR